MQGGLDARACIHVLSYLKQSGCLKNMNLLTLYNYRDTTYAIYRRSSDRHSTVCKVLFMFIIRCSTILRRMNIQVDIIGTTVCVSY